MTEPATESAPTIDYKIQLENYYGPLDLLLHLVREDEVEITDIPILRVTEQYIAFLNMMSKFDLNIASDFLVMAATLLVIKARMLAPRPLTEEDLEDAEQDPRFELIRKLIEYKKFKDAARGFGRLLDRQALRTHRRPYRPPTPIEEESKVELRVWDLVSAYARLMKTILLDAPQSILYDHVLVSSLMEEMVLRLRREKSFLFSSCAAPSLGKVRRVGNFLAMLQLAKQQIVTLEQPGDFADIRITLRDDADTEHAALSDEFDQGPAPVPGEPGGAAAAPPTITPEATHAEADDDGPLA